MAKEKPRPDYKKERQIRTPVDMFSTVVKDKTGQTVFDGRKLYEKKPKKEA